MLKFYKYILLSFSALLLISADLVHPQENLSRDIAASIANGDSEELAHFFNQSIDINLFGQADIYSKVHAEQLLHNFFKQFRPVSFQIIHNGQKGNENFTFGKLETSNGVFNVYFSIRSVRNQSAIYVFRIEEFL